MPKGHGLVVLVLAAVGFATANGACSSGNGGGGAGGAGGGGAAGTGGSRPSGTGGSGGSAGSSGSGGSAGARADAGAPRDTGAPRDGGTGDLTPPASSGQLFGSHTFKYPAGVLKPTGDQATLDAAVKKFYDAWSAKYLQEKCGGTVIVTREQGGSGGTGVVEDAFSVSEGHGYAMVITAMMAGYDPKAQARFDGLYKVFRNFPSTNDPNLMCWQLTDKCPAGSRCTMIAPACFKLMGPDCGSATDGDLDNAFGLLLADKQWGSNGPINYLAEAKKVIAAIKAKEFNPMTKLPVIADDIGPGDASFFLTRPSDFLVDHFRAYGRATGDVFWTQAVDTILGLIATLQMSYSPNTGLLPDFVVQTNATARPAPPNFPADEGPTTGEYSYNSCRVPWRLGTDFIASGGTDMRAKMALAKLNDFIRMTTGGDASKIVDGYKLNGTRGSDVSGPDMSFTAPFGVAALMSGDQKWVDSTWQEIVKTPIGVYFGDTIKMIAMIVISQNWWAP